MVPHIVTFKVDVIVPHNVSGTDLHLHHINMHCREQGTSIHQKFAYIVRNLCSKIAFVEKQGRQATVPVCLQCEELEFVELRFVLSTCKSAYIVRNHFLTLHSRYRAIPRKTRLALLCLHCEELHFAY